MIELVLIITGVILLCFGLSFLFRWTKKQEAQASGAKRSSVGTAKISGGEKSRKPAPCPVCSSILKEGERVKSVATRLANGDKLLHISGCPHCLYGEERRMCPVCSAELTRDEILVAKMTISVGSTGGKNNVRIFGCSRCGGKAAEWM